MWLEGLERAERNVLPVINNLLENREMSLDNGMLLVHPKRYDEIVRLVAERAPAREDYLAQVREQVWADLRAAAEVVFQLLRRGLPLLH